MFHNLLPKQPHQPLSPLLISRGMVLLIIVLALVGGYYYTVLQQERKRYLRLEDIYVRVRTELGVQETQRLIDQSRQAQP